MKILQTIPQNNLHNVAAAAKKAEDTGYDVLVTMENKHDPFLALGVAAVATEKIGLGTAVAIAFARSPMVVANASWDLQNTSGGRFVLGLGPQIRPHNEKRFSVPWSPPVPRLREYVRSLRAIWRSWETGERLRFEGKYYTFTLMTPDFTPPSASQPSVPITIAAVGEHSLRLSGEVCDGVRLHPFCTRAYLQDIAMKRIDEGMAKSGRSRETFEITGGGFLASGSTDEEVHNAAEWIRYRVAFYGSTPSYWPVLEHHGYGDLGRKLNRMTKQGQWDKIAAEVSDDVLNLFACIGRHDEIKGIIEKRFGGLADAIYANTSSEIHSSLPLDLLQDIKKIPISFKSFDSMWASAT
jgi:probable F420-dependent oxidoreductase